MVLVPAFVGTFYLYLVSLKIDGKQFTLGKDERLKSRKQIEQLFSEGKKFTVTPFRIFYLMINSLNTHTTDAAVGIPTRPLRRDSPLTFGLEYQIKTSNVLLTEIVLNADKRSMAFAKK
jgi:hypothetical protein